MGTSSLTSAGGRDLLPLQLGHRLAHHLHVEVVADGRDVARLVGAQQVARTPDLEVAHGDLEARPELGVLADGLEPLVGRLRQLPLGGEEEVGVGPLAGPAHPSPQLVELAQAHHVGPVDDQGVHRGHVDARLDDRRTDENVVLALPEVEDDPLQPTLVHLPVGHRHPGLGYQLPQPVGDPVDVLHPVVDEEHLSLPQQLPADRLAHRPLVVGPHVGEDGLALGGGGVEDGEVADAGEAHLQGAGDGRGREGEHVDVGPEALDGLLVGDAEALLLVDHQQAQVLELDVVREEPVGADDHVDAPVGQPVDHLLGLAGREEAGQDLDPHRVAGVALGEGAEVLLGEQGGGDEDGGLHPLLDGLERGPDGHLGLAEADVAADQAVHGAVGLHVVLHVLDGLELVGRLLVGEGVLQLPLPGGVGGEGVARGGDPLAVEGHQLLGDVTDGDPNLGLGAPPLGAAQPVEGGRVAAGVVADGVDLVGRDVELVAPPVLEQEVVALGPAHGLLDHAAVLADAVLVVDDVVARAEVVEEALGVGAPRAGRPVGPAPAGDVALDEDGQLDLGEDEAPLEGLDHDPAGRRVCSGRRPRPRGGRRPPPAAGWPCGRPSPCPRRPRPAGSPVPTRSATWRVRRSASPMTGSQPRDSMVVTSGPSAAPVTVHAGAGVWARRRSKGRWRRGHSDFSPLALAAPQVVARLAASDASSSSRSAARSRIRRGSTRRTRASGPSRSKRVWSPAVSHGSHDSMPSKTAPSASRSHCSRPHGSAPTSSAARARTSSVGSSSRLGKSSTHSTSSVERWSVTEKRVRRSTSSPQRSMRTG